MNPRIFPEDHKGGGGVGKANSINKIEKFLNDLEGENGAYIRMDAGRPRVGLLAGGGASPIKFIRVPESSALITVSGDLTDPTMVYVEINHNNAPPTAQYTATMVHATDPLYSYIEINYLALGILPLFRMG